MAAGVPDDVFQRTTPRELWALLEQINERETARQDRQDQRAGLITAAVYNTMRGKKSDRLWKPDDFFRKPKRVMTAEEMERVMDTIMARQNRIAEA